MFQKIMICPKCKEGELRTRKGKYGPFMGCSQYPNCDYIFKERRGGYPEPSYNASPDPVISPTMSQQPKDEVMLALRKIWSKLEVIERQQKNILDYFINKGLESKIEDIPFNDDLGNH